MANIRGKALVLAFWLEARDQASKSEDGTFYLRDVVRKLYGESSNVHSIATMASRPLRDLGIIHHTAYSGRFTVQDYALWEFEMMDPPAFFYNH